VKMENGFVAYDAFLKCEVCDEFLDLCWSFLMIAIPIHQKVFVKVCWLDMLGDNPFLEAASMVTGSGSCRICQVHTTTHLKTYVNHFCIIFLSFLCRFKIYFTDLVYWFIYLFYFFWIFIYFIFAYFILFLCILFIYLFYLFIYFAELHSCFCHRCHSLQRRNFVDKSAISTE
jgi:hypothetical protein